MNHSVVKREKSIAISQNGNLTYRIVLNFCCGLLLRMGDFLVFYGNSFFLSGKTGYSCQGLIFAIFGGRVQAEL